jgi:hypothetical protein
MLAPDDACAAATWERLSRSVALVGDGVALGVGLCFGAALLMAVVRVANH